MSSEELGPMKKLMHEGVQILKKFQDRLDWKDIDKHESLTFLDKNFRKKPSDIAKPLLYILAFIIFYIEGFRTLTILMCYLLPIGIMILKICEAMRNKKKKFHEVKQKLNYSQFEEKTSLQKNDSVLSINSRKNDNKLESETQKSHLLERQDKVQQSASNSSQVETNSNQEIAINELCKLFIFYFVINLTIDLTEPLLLLILQTILNLGEVVIISILELIVDGNLWALLYLPFKFIIDFVIQTLNFKQVNSLSNVLFIILRIFISAFLLNMNQKQRNACIKLLFELKLETLPFLQMTEEKPKNE